MSKIISLNSVVQQSQQCRDKIDRIAMSIERDKMIAPALKSRREWLKQVGLFSVSGLFLGACTSAIAPESKSSTMKDNADSDPDKNQVSGIVKDASLLNAALALEHEAIALYTAAAGLDFMQESAVAPILSIAGSFLGHHIEHRDALIGAIEELKKKDSAVSDPVMARDDAEYVTPVASKLTDVTQVLRLASLKEMGAAKAYLGLISSFTQPELAKTSGMLGGDEAAHYGVLRAALFAVLGDTDIAAEDVRYRRCL